MTHFTTENLSFAYENRVVFHSLSMDLRAGEIVALIGANGAGKTTLLRTMAKQLKQQSGTVLLDSQSTQKFTRREIAKHLSLMPQHEQREASLRVYDVVALGRAPHVGWWMPLRAEDEAIVRQSLEATAMTELQERTIDQLSGGEWRRMILARSLAQNASILLLDEPTAGLDMKYQFECLGHVRRMVKERQLIAVITLHDLNQASMFADRIAILANKELLSIGPPQEVMRPDLIRKAFGIDVMVVSHPTESIPMVVPILASKEV